MSYKFGERSKEIRNTLHPKLQSIVDEVLKIMNISLISGHRDKLEQNVLYKEGRSKLKYPKSRHNSNPSEAVDVMLWNKEKPHIRWNDVSQMQLVAGVFIATAYKLGIKIRSGADWNSNYITDESFYDGGHFELDKSEV